MLRLATAADAPFVRALWERADNRMVLSPPGEGDEDEIAAALAAGTLLLWQRHGTPAGFACILRWVPGSYGISALAVTTPGRGEGRAMLSAVLDLLFADPQTHRVSLDTVVDNAPALALFDRLGFVREGVFRECWQRPDGIWADCACLSVLRREWRPGAGSAEPPQPTGSA